MNALCSQCTPRLLVPAVDASLLAASAASNKQVGHAGLQPEALLRMIASAVAAAELHCPGCAARRMVGTCLRSTDIHTAGTFCWLIWSKSYCCELTTATMANYQHTDSLSWCWAPTALSF